MAGARFIGGPGTKQRPDQAERRSNLKLTDQHNRPYHVIFDPASMVVVGVLPLYNAPWMPHDIDIQAALVQTEQGFPIRLHLDYDTMLRKNREAWERWFGDLRSIGGKMNGVDATAAFTAALEKRWHDIPKGLLIEAGQTPLPDDYILAAKAGNSWVLGFTDVVPKWAEGVQTFEAMWKKLSQRPVTEGDLDRYRDGAEDEVEVAPPSEEGPYAPTGSVTRIATESVTETAAPVAKKKRGRPPKTALATD